jgi:hypothetical protein
VAHRTHLRLRTRMPRDINGIDGIGMMRSMSLPNDENGRGRE